MLEIKGNYFYENGRPFFWLGDTAWFLFCKLSEEEMISYLQKRKEQGFTAIQCVLVQSINGEYRNDCQKKEYWQMVKRVVAYARSLGLYMGLLPSWGSIVKERILTLDNILRYADFLNTTFNGFDNIVWILGGDIRGDVNFPLYQALGKAIKAYCPSRLITFHPFGRTGSYQWFSKEEWLDFHLFQSGHRRYDQRNMDAWDEKKENEEFYGEDNYRYVMKNREYTPFKPCLDGEPSYEGILQGLHHPNEPYWEAKPVRRYAYWSLFEGACGFTYGNNAVMQFYNGKEKGAYGVRETWQEGLLMEGASQMWILKELFFSFPFDKGHPASELVVNQKSRYERVGVFAGENYILAYTYTGKPFELSLREYKDKVMNGYWVSPMTYQKTFISSFTQMDSAIFKSLDNEDNILVLVEKDNDKFKNM